MSNTSILFSPFEKQQKFLDAVFSGMYSFLLYGGAIKGGKTIIGIATLILLCRLFPGSRWAIVRVDRPTIVQNVFPNLDKILPVHFVKKDARYNILESHIEFNNGSKIIFFPENFARDKDLNRWKGFDVNGMLLEEINELQEQTFNKAIERSGTYIIPKTENYPEPKQPNPLILATCNPSFGWVKTRIYNSWEDGTLKSNYFYIAANPYDNPYNTQKYLEGLKDLPKYEYEVFVLGNWNVSLKKSNAYWRGFELDKHLSNIPINPKLPIHTSIDNNVLPYCAISLWQLDGGHAIQIAEIAAADPDNTAQKSATLVNKYLTKIGHEDLVILHGDASAKAKNTIDNEKRSFITLHEGVLKEEFIVQNRVSNSNPSITIRGEFINAVYEGLVPGLSISINENCKDSINDYISVVQDENSGMQKRRITKNGLTYEPHGHFSDTKAYFLCDVWKKEFNEFKNAGSTHEYILKINKSHNVM